MQIKNSNGHTYEVLGFDLNSDYYLLESLKTGEYVVANHISEPDEQGLISWGHGHYFSGNLELARAYYVSEVASALEQNAKDRVFSSIYEDVSYETKFNEAIKQEEMLDAPLKENDLPKLYARFMDCDSITSMFNREALQDLVDELALEKEKALTEPTNPKDILKWKDEDTALTCWDTVMDTEYYLYYDTKVASDNYDKCMKYLVENLEVKSLSKRGATLNLYEMLDNPIIIEYAKQNMFKKSQYDDDDEVVEMLFDDMIANINNGYEGFSKRILEAFALVDASKREVVLSDIEKLDVKKEKGGVEKDKELER